MGKKRKLLVAAALTTAVVTGVHIINRAVFFYSTMKDRLKGNAGSFYEWRFGNIYYTKEGSGKPLLLVHRLEHTASGYEWESLRKELAKDHTVYTLDLLGCGRSAKPKITYTNYLYVQMLNDFIKEVIKGKADVVTSGNASSLASMACLIEPGLYHRLVFLQPEKISATGKTPKGNHKVLKYLIETPIIGTCIYNIASSRWILERKCRSSYFVGTDFDKKEIMETMSEASHLGGASARYVYASVRSHFSAIYIGNAIKQLNHSIFIIGSDTKEAQDTMAEYKEYNPAIETEIVHDAGLLVQIEKTDEVLELCRLFLE